MRSVNHRFALSNPALVSVLLGKSGSLFWAGLLIGLTGVLKETHGIFGLGIATLALMMAPGERTLHYRWPALVLAGLAGIVLTQHLLSYPTATKGYLAYSAAAMSIAVGFLLSLVRSVTVRRSLGIAMLAFPIAWGIKNLEPKHWIDDAGGAFAARGGILIAKTQLGDYVRPLTDWPPSWTTKPRKGLLLADISTLHYFVHNERVPSFNIQQFLYTANHRDYTAAEIAWARRELKLETYDRVLIEHWLLTRLVPVLGPSFSVFQTSGKYVELRKR